jgi:hypothetical protein
VVVDDADERDGAVVAGPRQVTDVVGVKAGIVTGVDR